MNRSVVLATVTLCIARCAVAQVPFNPNQFRPKNFGPGQFDPSKFADPNAMFKSMFGSDPNYEAKLAKVVVPIADERRAGNGAAKNYLSELKRQKIKPLDVKHADVAYITELVAKVRPLLTNAKRYRKIKVYVLESKRTDARAFPGGTVFVHQGLLDFAKSEAAVVGVLGHELAHIDRGHQLRQMKMAQMARQQSRSATQFFMNNMNLYASFAKPFRPEDEAQADADGAKWAFQLGYEPAELADLFLRMHERDKSKNQAGNLMPSFLRSHPYHIDRNRALLKQSEELRNSAPGKDLHIGHKNLKQRKVWNP